MVLLVNNGLVVIRGWYCCGGEGISIDLTQGSSSCCTHIVEGKEKKIRGKLVHRRSAASASSGSRTGQGQRNYDRDASPQHAIHPPTSQNCPRAITLLLPILCIDNISSTSCMMDEIRIVLGFNLFPKFCNWNRIVVLMSLLMLDLAAVGH